MTAREYGVLSGSGTSAQQSTPAIQSGLVRSGFAQQNFGQVDTRSALEKGLMSIPLVSQLSSSDKSFIVESIRNIPDPYGVQFVNVNDPDQALEVVNFFRKEIEAAENPDLRIIVPKVIEEVKFISQSGDHFIWSLPVMLKYEETAQFNIKKEFASLEGVELERTNPITGVREKIKCGYPGCDSTWWIVAPKVMKRAGDEMLEVNANCKKCSRPRKNI